MAGTASNVPAVIRPFARYVDFMGRSTRPEFWMFLLLNYLVVALIAAFVAGTSMNGKLLDMDRLMVNYMRFAPLLNLFNLAVILPNLSVRVRRLHDLGRSGWWILFPFVVSVIAYIVFFIFNGPVFFQTAIDMGRKMKDLTDPAAITPAAMLRLEWPLWQLMLPWVLGPSLAAELIMWIAYAWPGSQDSNRFGPNPKIGARVEVF